jgi:PKD repeat protein
MDENTNPNPVPVPPSNEDGTPPPSNIAIPQSEAPAEPVQSDVPVIPLTEPVPVTEAPVVEDVPVVEESIHEEELPEATQNSAQNLPDKSQNGDINEMASERKMGAWALLKWFVGFGGILLILFYVVLLWGLLGGNVSNPLFEALNIQETDLQSTLLNLTNYIFGFLAIFFLVGTLVKFFQWLMLGRDAVNRRQYGKKSALFLAIFVSVCVIWVGVFWIITNANAEHQQLNKSIILTHPEKVIGLNAPVTVEFDVGTELFKQIDPELVRQINWDFEGDGQVDATGPKVTYRFLKKGADNGRYTVTAMVDYYSPSAQMEKTYTAEKQVVIVNESVQAFFTADREEGIVPLTVQFSAKESLDPDGEIVLYEWDLDGDGVYEILGGEKVDIKNTYSKVGETEVTLRVTGTNNDSDTAKKSIVIRQSKENIRGKIVSDQGFTGVPPFSVNLSGEQSYTRFGNIISYLWQVEGEEESVPGRKLQRVFRTPGEYIVSLIIENDVGERDKVEQVIRVVPQLDDAKLKITTKPETEEGSVLRGNAPFEITFSADMSEIHNPIEWKWDAEGDGEYDTFEQTATHVYTEAGEYDLTLTVTDSFENTITTVQKVIVDRAGVQARINADPTFGTVPLTVEFDGSASTTDEGEIVLYTWQFPGQVPIPSGAKISYEFKNVGTFPVKLTILTSEQEVSDTQTLISVRSLPLMANFDAIPSDDNPLEIQFDSTSSTGTVAEYLWTFGDGAISRTFMPTHVYGFAGEFDVTLKITDGKGVVSTFTEKITVGGDE